MAQLQASGLWGNWTDNAASPTALLYTGGRFVAGWNSSTALQSVSTTGHVSGTSNSVSGFFYSSALAIQSVTIGGTSYLFTTGHYAQDVLSYRIGPTGGIDPPTKILGTDGLVSGLATYAGGSTTSIYTISRKGTGVSVWQGDMSQGWTKVQEAGTTGWTKTGGLTALKRVGDVVYVASSDKNSLTSLHIRANGQLEELATLDATKGLLVTSPSALSSVQVAGQDYMILGANSSNSLAVIRLDANGAMQVTDQINDSLHTRFERVTTLHSFGFGDKAYVLAAGGDKGLSLFTFLPGGRLLHTASIADTLATTLDQITDIETTLRSDGFDVYVTSATEAGVTKLSFAADGNGTVTSGDGTLTGTVGADILRAQSGSSALAGLGGDDILMDGLGADSLTGGAGADVFVLRKDGVADTITDFDPRYDRIDLSALGPVHDTSALVFSALAGGITIQAGDEITHIRSYNGQAFQATQFTNVMLFDADRVDVTNAPLVAPAGIAPDPRQDDPYYPPPLNQRDNSDTYLYGEYGRQTLATGSGNDLISAETGHAYDVAYSYATRLYQASFGRKPDWDGLRQWGDRLNGGMTKLEAAQGFAASQEFQARTDANTPEGFITLMYQNVLGRDPDPTGFAAWTDRMQAGLSKADVLMQFTESGEFILSTRARVLEYSWAADRANWSQHVFQLYQATFNREPDLDGFLHWTNAMASRTSPTDIAAQFASSPEFQTTYGTLNNDDFVRLMYRNVLGRDPDPGGFAAWMDRLNSGSHSRAMVLDGFARSVELTETSTPLIKTWMRARPDDVISPAAGDNVIFGGVLSDKFVFDAQVTTETTIADFEHWDILYLRDFGYTDPADARAHMTQLNDQVIFEDQNVRIVLEDTLMSDLDDGAFLF